MVSGMATLTRGERAPRGAAGSSRGRARQSRLRAVQRLPAGEVRVARESTSSTCARWPQHGPNPQLVNRLLTNCPGVMSRAARQARGPRRPALVRPGRRGGELVAAASGAIPPITVEGTTPLSSQCT